MIVSFDEIKKNSAALLINQVYNCYREYIFDFTQWLMEKSQISALVFSYQLIKSN